MDKKQYKIVYGYNEGDYLPITSDELHKAQVIAIQGGSANFEAGFFNNRGNDIMRIVPDWHKVKGWNRSHKMDEFDYKDIEPLTESYKKTLYNSQQLAQYIISNNRQDLLLKSAPEAFKEIPKLKSPIDTKQLENKFQVKQK